MRSHKSSPTPSPSPPSASASASEHASPAPLATALPAPPASPLLPGVQDTSHGADRVNESHEIAVTNEASLQVVMEQLAINGDGTPRLSSPSPSPSLAAPPNQFCAQAATLQPVHGYGERFIYVDRQIEEAVLSIGWYRSTSRRSDR